MQRGTAVRKLTWGEVCARRLERHALLAPRQQEELVEVVRAVGGIHAQMMSAAGLSIGVRLAGVTRREVHEELCEEVARRAGSWAVEAVSPAFGSRWPRWLITLGAAANAGLLCFGPQQG